MIWLMEDEKCITSNKIIGPSKDNLEEMIKELKDKRNYILTKKEIVIGEFHCDVEGDEVLYKRYNFLSYGNGRNHEWVYESQSYLNQYANSLSILLSSLNEDKEELFLSRFFPDMSNYNLDALNSLDYISDHIRLLLSNKKYQSLIAQLYGDFFYFIGHQHLFEIVKVKSYNIDELRAMMNGEILIHQDYYLIQDANRQVSDAKVNTKILTMANNIGIALNK